MKKEENDYDFVARHYRRDAFRTEAAWRRLGIQATGWWTRTRIAASVAIFITVSATAAFLMHDSFRHEGTDAAVEQYDNSVSVSRTVKSLDFDGATLSEVVAAINETYGVEVTGLPDNADEYHLTLHYEGNVVSLIETINDILGTSLKIKEQ